MEKANIAARRSHFGDVLRWQFEGRIRMIEWQQYPGRGSENTEYAIVNDRKVEMTNREHGEVSVKLYKKMTPMSPRGTPWWRLTGAPLRLMNRQAAKEYAEGWLTGAQDE